MRPCVQVATPLHELFLNISSPLQWSRSASIKYTIMSSLFVLVLAGLSMISDEMAIICIV